jgi:putative selenium metabolism protein SsnA
MGGDSSTIIVDGMVVTGGSGSRVIEDGGVAVSGQRITAVGPASEIAEANKTARIVDASGKLVMPGLINAHTHLYSALARGLTADIAPSGSFVEILEHLWWRLDRALTRDDVWYSAAAGAIDLVRNGTTFIIDHHASQAAIAGSLGDVAAALEETGIRANLSFEVSDRGGPEARDAGLAENDRFAGWAEEQSRSGGASAGMLSASVGLHASLTLSDETLDRAAEIAASHGVGCHVHVAEDLADVEDSLRRSGMRVVERLASHGVLGSRSVAAHCVHVDEAEVGILGESRTPVVHNPQSNMNNAVGCADVPYLLDQDVLVGLGTDGFSASMFDEMKAANLIHRHEARDPAVGHDVAVTLGLANNPVIAERVTGQRLGVLEPGALADLIVLDYDPPTPLVDGNFGGHLIFGLTGWMVESVMINGRFVMRDREMVTIDVAETLEKARERSRALWERM